MKRARIQNGTVVLNKRFGTWNFLWFEGGRRRSRKLGDVSELRTKEAAVDKAVVLRRQLGFEREISIPDVKMLVKQFELEKMSKRHSTRRVGRIWLNKYVLPTWGHFPITKLQPRPVELWLCSLNLAPKTRSHLRGLLNQIWEYAMWSGAVPVQVNPISLVTIKGSSKRCRQPRSLNVDEFHRLVKELREPFKTMGLISVCLGLRVSETLALRWQDVDWLGARLNVERGIVNQVVDEVKTNNSRKFMTLEPELLGVFANWKQISQFTKDTDWIFASPVKIGRLPYSYTGFRRELQRAAKDAGLGGLGTHVFRHSYRSWLDAVGTSIAVQQKLMRHSDIRTTMNIYGTVVTNQMERANAQVAGLALKTPN
jgi:integrase